MRQLECTEQATSFGERKGKNTRCYAGIESEWGLNYCMHYQSRHASFVVWGRVDELDMSGYWNEFWAAVTSC